MNQRKKEKKTNKEIFRTLDTMIRCYVIKRDLIMKPYRINDYRRREMNGIETLLLTAK